MYQKIAYFFTLLLFFSSNAFASSEEENSSLENDEATLTTLHEKLLKIGKKYQAIIITLSIVGVYWLFRRYRRWRREKSMMLSVAHPQKTYKATIVS